MGFKNQFITFGGTTLAISWMKTRDLSFCKLHRAWVWLNIGYWKSTGASHPLFFWLNPNVWWNNPYIGCWIPEMCSCVISPSANIMWPCDITLYPHHIPSCIDVFPFLSHLKSSVLLKWSPCCPFFMSILSREFLGVIHPEYPIHMIAILHSQWDTLGDIIFNRY